MKNRFPLRKTVYLLTIMIIISFVFVIISVIIDRMNPDDMGKLLERKFLMEDEEIAGRQVTYNPEDLIVKAELSDENNVKGDGLKFQAEGVLVPIDASCKVNLSIPAAGDYQILVEYSSAESNLFENPVNISVNDYEVVCSLPFLWSDDISDICTDRYGNEIVPDQYQMKVHSLSMLEDYGHFQRTPIIFTLEEGENLISFTPQNQDMLLYSVSILRIQEEMTYGEYRNLYAKVPEYDGAIIVEGEDYRAKSDSYIRGRNVQNSGMIPNNTYVKLINATDDKANKVMGQEIIYEVDIPTDGIYYLTFKYCQPLKTGGQVYRTIEVDGKIPFKEARDIGFVHTGLDKYRNFTIGGNEPMGLYFSAGLHTITLKVTAGPMDDIYQELLGIVDEINDTSIQLKKIKGSNSDDTAMVDKNRIWDITQYMPDIVTDLKNWQKQLEDIYGRLKVIGSGAPAYASDLMLAAQNLKRLASQPREIPNRMSLLSDDASSAAQLISLTLSKIYDQNLSIDRFFLHGKGYDLPSPKENFFTGLLIGMKQFIYSFSPIMNEAVDISKSDGSLTVWVNKPFQYVEALRELTAQDFTQETGIDVVFSIMPDEKKITLANSTGANPDMALSISFYRPAEFAMRGMAKNLLDYEDFLDWYGEEYNLEALTPMAYEDGIYGASETQDFYVLFYRKDILDMLWLEVPDTWDDVKKMMPVLLRNSMNFNHPLANTLSYKSFEAAGNFIFQNGGDYYSADGFNANFNDPATLKGLKEMVDMYRVYGLAQNVPNFFVAFRSGYIPIGISNFSTYLQLQMAAPELAGRWGIALVPGTLKEDGSVARYFSADYTAAMIFSNTKMPDEAYKFMKWWLSSDTQSRYAIDLQMKYGPEYIWNTANHVALAQLPYPRKHKEIILEQWSWQKEALRHPASYILEREVSNAWIDIVTKGENFQPRIDEALLNANREMKRKLTEFGYYDEEGNKVKDYNMHLMEDIIAKQREEQQNE